MQRVVLCTRPETDKYDPHTLHNTRHPMTTNPTPNTSMLPPNYDERPPYSPSLESYGLALFKIERKTPWSDESTSLQPVILELNSNQLRIYLLNDSSRTQLLIRALYKYQNGCDGKDVSDEWDTSDDEEDALMPKNGSGFLSRMKDRALRAKVVSLLKSQLLLAFCDNLYFFEPTSSSQAEHFQSFLNHRGALLHVFTLLNLSIGKAPFIGLLKRSKLLDTKNNPALLHERNVLRLRVEHMQILLHFWSFHGMVHWFRNLLIGRDLAQLIDHRRLLVLKSLSSSPLLIEDGYFADGKPLANLSHGRSPSSSSEESIGTSVFSQRSGETLDDEEFYRKSVTIMGQTLYCLEDEYSYFEKRYIGRCLPILNSFDRWQGSKVALSNFEQLGLKSDGKNPDVDGQMYILGRKFNKVAKSISSASTGQGQCKEFYVYQLGLYTCKEKKRAE